MLLFHNFDWTNVLLSVLLVFLRLFRPELFRRVGLIFLRNICQNFTSHPFLFLFRRPSLAQNFHLVPFVSFSSWVVIPNLLFRPFGFPFCRASFARRFHPFHFGFLFCRALFSRHAHSNCSNNHLVSCFAHARSARSVFFLLKFCWTVWYPVIILLLSRDFVIESLRLGSSLTLFVNCSHLFIYFQRVFGYSIITFLLFGGLI